jgi:hypothetical protein
MDRRAKGRVGLKPRRADAVLVQRVVQEQRIGAIALVDDPLNISKREGAGVLAVARETRAAIAAERVLIEKPFAVELAHTRGVANRP